MTPENTTEVEMVEQKTAAMLQDRYGPKVRPIAFVCQLPRLTHFAREYGYALAVHGSLQSDLDLVACPWSETAVSAEEFAVELAIIVGGFILEQNKQPTVKPHGRLAWVIHLGGGMYIDLSVMPRILK